MNHLIHDPNLLTLCFVLALLIIVGGALLWLWLRHLWQANSEPEPCGAWGMCAGKVVCPDHYCPGHPRNAPRRNVVHMHFKSGHGERVDTN